MLEKTLPKDEWTLVESAINTKVYLLDTPNSFTVYKVYTITTGGTAPNANTTACAWVEYEGFRQAGFTVNSPDTAVDVYIMAIEADGRVVYPES